jgi:hypothetical protein
MFDLNDKIMLLLNNLFAVSIYIKLIRVKLPDCMIDLIYTMVYVCICITV